jgi:LssY C-terminus
LFSAYFGKVAAYILVAIFLLPCASAQEINAIPARLIIPDGIPIKLQLVESVSSAHARPGDQLDFVVVRDVNLEGLTVISAGTAASGSVTAVRRKRFLGIGGRVALKLNSVVLANGQRIGLRARMAVKGRTRIKMMAAAMIATGLVFLPASAVFLLTRGHDSIVLKSTAITAHTDNATSVSSAELKPSVERSSELAEMMDYLPPRVINIDGREGDMLNLVFVAQPEELQQMFARAGWIKTDDWKPIFVWHLLRHGNHDTQLPMAKFYLFGRVQDYSYALPDPNAIVTRRHHLRIWKTDYTMDGTPIWAGAASHDVAIVIGKRGHLINHRIDPNVDAERDFVGSNLTESSSVSQQEYLRSNNPIFQAQTSSGDSYHSDSRLLLLDFHSTDPMKANETGQPAPLIEGASPAIATPTESLVGNLTSPRD